MKEDLMLYYVEKEIQNVCGFPGYVKDEIRDEICGFESWRRPKSKYSLVIDFLFACEIAIEVLKEHNIMKSHHEKKLRDRLKYFRYWACLNDPATANNPKLSETVQMFCLNHFLSSERLSVQVGSFNG